MYVIFSNYRDNFLVLDIFFEALNYETIEQKKAYDVAGLLGGCLTDYWVGTYLWDSNGRMLLVTAPPVLRAGDIGGQMGLFIGASVLTVLEIFDYIYEVIPHLCS